MKAIWDGQRLTLKEHHMPRAEWERRFGDELKRLAGVEDSVVAAELQSWPVEDDDWLTEGPESAAAENLNYWTNDE